MLREKRFRLLTLGELALVDHRGRSDGSLATRPRKLALLTVLALAARPVTRDALVGTFWGEQEEARAHHSLSDALSHLRRALGQGAIVSHGSNVALADNLPLDVDVLELERAAHADDHPEVTRLYRGPFLESVFVNGSPDFEQWVGRERQRIELLFFRSAAAHCEILARTGRWDSCAALSKRWLDAAPTSADAAMHLLTAVGAPGTREAALRALAEYDRLVRRLDDDYVLAPEKRVAQLAENIREQAHQTVETQMPVSPGATSAVQALPSYSVERRRALGMSLAALVVALVALVAVLVGRL